MKKKNSLRFTVAIPIFVLAFICEQSQVIAGDTNPSGASSSVSQETPLSSNSTRVDSPTSARAKFGDMAADEASQHKNEGTVSARDKALEDKALGDKAIKDLEEFVKKPITRSLQVMTAIQGINFLLLGIALLFLPDRRLLGVICFPCGFLLSQLSAATPGLVNWLVAVLREANLL